MAERERPSRAPTRPSEAAEQKVEIVPPATEPIESPKFGADEVGEIVPFEQFMGAFMGPIADAEKHKATERTKQTEIEAGVQKKAIASGFWIVVGIIVLAGIALFRSAPEVTKELVIALIAGAGGFGFGRAVEQRRHDSN